MPLPQAASPAPVLLLAIFQARSKLEIGVSSQHPLTSSMAIRTLTIATVTVSTTITADFRRPPLAKEPPLTLTTRRGHTSQPQQYLIRAEPTIRKTKYAVSA